jgi:aminotransferase
MINLFQPSAGEAEAGAISEVLQSNWIGTGESVKRFESDFASYIGCTSSDTLAIGSCTEGLFQSVTALGLGAGDEVVIPTVSFLGAAHAVSSVGARVTLCDVDPLTLNPTVSHIERAASEATKAVMILHYGGEPGDVRMIAELARDRGWFLIEDAACGLGSFVDERACGTFGDIGVWSFDSMKVLTTGDGGMVWCRSDRVAEQIRMSIRLGVGSSGFDRRGATAGWWKVDPSVTGRRGTMNNLAAAMGCVQLERLPAFLARRREIAQAYDAALSEIKWLRLPRRGTDAGRIFYWVQTELRDRLALHMLDRGIYTSFRYWPLHRTSLYACDRAFPGADQAAAETLLLPLHQGLSDTEMEAVIGAVQAFRGEFSLRSAR